MLPSQVQAKGQESRLNGGRSIVGLQPRFEHGGLARLFGLAHIHPLGGYLDAFASFLVERA